MFQTNEKRVHVFHNIGVCAVVFCVAQYLKPFIGLCICQRHNSKVYISGILLSRGVIYLKKWFPQILSMGFSDL